jgi:hypothetical protein
MYGGMQIAREDEFSIQNPLLEWNGSTGKRCRLCGLVCKCLLASNSID